MISVPTKPVVDLFCALKSALGGRKKTERPYRTVPAASLDMLRHALGIQLRAGKWTKPYRNFFIAGSSDVAAWQALCRLGLARLTSGGGALTGDNPLFAVTERGRALALDGLWGEKASRPYRLKTAASAYGETPTFATEGAARDGAARLAIGTRWTIEKRIGSRHSRKYAVVAEGVREK